MRFLCKKRSKTSLLHYLRVFFFYFENAKNLGRSEDGKRKKKRMALFIILHYILEVVRNALGDMSLHTSQQIASFVLENFCVNFYLCDRSLSLQVVQDQMSFNFVPLTQVAKIFAEILTYTRHDLLQIPKSFILTTNK